MPRYPETDQLGEPDIRAAGFQLWVHGRQYPDSTDVYDGNWLNITAHAGGLGASVFASGAIMMVNDLVRWSLACDALAISDAKEAMLTSYEPNLKVEVRPLDSLGHFIMVVRITPEHLSQKHEFEFGIDQTELRDLARACRKIAKTYPVRGEPEDS
jgi:hypothetical protein